VHCPRARDGFFTCRARFLQARHVRGRTIYAVPDRVVYGYFDMLVRLTVETGQWDKVAAIPILVPSRDFESGV
jgi:hypothetical protein